MKRSRYSTEAFSLVEVALALGIAAFCFVCILALLGAGLTTSQSSSTQTVAANLMTAIASDLRSTPNPVPAGGTSTNSLIYGIAVPATGGSTTSQTFYIAENGQTNGTAAGARYQLNTWSIPATTTRQETVVRLFLTWPAQAPYTNAAGSMEAVVAMNRAP